MDIIDVGIIGSYILIGLCALAAVVMPLIQSFSDPKSLIKSAAGVGAIVVVFFISYVIADGSSDAVAESTSKRVGAGIITTYIAFFVAIGGIIYTEVSKLLD